ncbi:MAG TPA: hypothetical protein VLK25_10855 [Allosphingosinicella sp.]|nr:hypothetical protein [Allosphingosinicella sp.]
MRAPLRLIVAALVLSGAGAAPARNDAPGRVNPAEVEAAAAQLGRQLPMRVDDVTTAVGIRAEGTAFVYEMVVDDSITREQFRSVKDAVEAANRSNLCAQEEVATFIRRGGSMRHIYRNQAGDRFETRLTSCPAPVQPAP